jgi:hypothetical protein
MTSRVSIGAPFSSVALRLDPAERHHLFSLYDLRTPERRLPGEEHVGEPLRHMVDGLAGQPAFVLGWRWDIVRIISSP